MERRSNKTAYFGYNNLYEMAYYLGIKPLATHRIMTARIFEKKLDLKL